MGKAKVISQVDNEALTLADQKMTYHSRLPTAKEYIAELGGYVFNEKEEDYILEKIDEARKKKEIAFVLKMEMFETIYPIYIMMALEHDGWKTTRQSGLTEVIIVEVPIGIIRSQRVA